MVGEQVPVHIQGALGQAAAAGEGPGAAQGGGDGDEEPQGGAGLPAVDGAAGGGADGLPLHQQGAGGLVQYRTAPRAWMARAVAAMSWLPAMWERRHRPRDRAAQSMARWATLLLGGRSTCPPRNVFW